jgi:hypothetical protein
MCVLRRRLAGRWISLSFSVIAVVTAGLVFPAQADEPPVKAIDDDQPVVVASYAPALPETVPPSIANPADRDGELPIVVVIGGDLGLGGSDQPISEAGAYRHGQRYAWADITRSIAPHINGDLNFANLETVVTDNKRLKPIEKTFRFRSHPAGVTHLVRMGFNAFSLANNHMIDFGAAGMRETLKHMHEVKSHGLLLAAGLGIGSDAVQPSVATVRGATFALSAIGIGGPPARGGNIGMASYWSEKDFSETMQGLAASGSDYKILSVHYNQERAVRPPAEAVRRFRDIAIRKHGIDLVAGHHAHVAAGVQRVGDKFVFYGLGNLLHPGMQNMARFNRCRDYGLLARLHLTRRPDGRLTAAAVQVIPLADMHLRARAKDAREGQRRIEVLNVLAADLDDPASDSEGVRFRPQPDGTGLYCTDKARTSGGELGGLCTGWSPPVPLAPEGVRSVQRACGDELDGSTLVVRRGQSRTRVQGKRRKTIARPAARNRASRNRLARFTDN